jgi:transposase
MIPIPSGARVWLVTGHTDMRKGFDGLALIVQETLRRDPHSGHLFVFRGRRGSLIKCLWATARAYACSQSDWSAGDSCGHRWLTER